MNHRKRLRGITPAEIAAALEQAPTHHGDHVVACGDDLVCLVRVDAFGKRIAGMGATPETARLKASGISGAQRLERVNRLLHRQHTLRSCYGKDLSLEEERELAELQAAAA